MPRQAPYPIRWAKAALASQLGRRELLVCFALAVHMNAQGTCRPSIATIARLSKYGRTSVIEALNELERSGWITRSRTTRANRYAGLIPGEVMVALDRTSDGRSRPTTKSPEKSKELDDAGGW